MECLEKFADTPDKKVQIEDSRNSSLTGRENSEEWYPDNHVMQGEALLPPFKTQHQVIEAPALPENIVVYPVLP